MRAPAPRGRRTTSARARRALRGWAMVTGCAVVLAGCATEGLPQSALDPAGPVARAEDNLWKLVLSIAAIVFVLVEGLLIVSLVKFRSRGGIRDEPLPKQVAGNTRLEVLWTLIPAAILVVIAVPTVRVIFELAQDPGPEALQVRVIGKQYWWEFEYALPGQPAVITATDLHIPAGRPVHLTMVAQDAQIPNTEGGVIHAFWVPRLAGKQDVVPGHERPLTIEADEPGVYPGQCAEFCGLSHANMRFRVIAHTPEDFEQWVADWRAPPQAPSGLAEQGRQVFVDAQCIACHAINDFERYSGGVPSDLRIGPDLTGFADRETFIGAILENNEENLRAWLANPQAVKPGAQMPNLQLTDEQLDALIAYLYTLD
jgi:cytochrome c oxidase subunit 2